MKQYQLIASVLLLLGLLNLQAAELQTFNKVRLLSADWADGDSFPVQFADGQKFTLRLYGVDCFESITRDDADARRLRTQRRYFGISGYGGEPRTSIELAKAQGKAATAEVQRLLKQPFTVHTSFADGRGDTRYKRIYAFVITASGQDLGTQLVASGLARAYGVARGAPDGQSREAYRETLRDAELVAARKERGVWRYTDWDALPKERRVQREEEAELQLATRRSEPTGPVDINIASRDELMQLPGIGEVLALGIIENRPYRSVDELERVPRVGAGLVEKLKPYLKGISNH